MLFEVHNKYLQNSKSQFNKVNKQNDTLKSCLTHPYHIYRYGVRNKSMYTWNGGCGN